jgi:nucleolar protein 12
VQYANNTVFQGHTLRVDRASAKGASAVDKGSDSATAGIDGEGHEAAPMTGRARLEAAAAEQKAKQEEERRTLYVGSLDFEETEQQLRDLCERLMREEKGEASPAPDGAGARAQWVERVRVVKDGETGLGKGFAYVIFRVSLSENRNNFCSCHVQSAMHRDDKADGL